MVMPLYWYSTVFVTTSAWADAARSAVASAAIQRAVAETFMAPPGVRGKFDSASVQPVRIRKLGEDPPQAPGPARAQHREVRVALADPVLEPHAQAVARIPEEVDREAYGDVRLHRRVEGDQHALRGFLLRE